MEKSENYLDVNMVKRLKRIIDETKALVVLASSRMRSFYYCLKLKAETENEEERLYGLLCIT